MDRPLEGQRVVVTRAAGQAESFNRQLREAGAEVLEYPVIALAEPESWAPADAALAALDSYHWLVFTSANAVAAFFDRAGVHVPRARLCAVGPATQRALESRGLGVSLVPGDFIGEGVVEALKAQGVAGQRILLPRAAVARDVVPDGLRALGAVVDVVDVYRNVLPANPGPFPAADWVTFTSASTVKNLLVLAGREALAGVKTASIGPQTSEALRKHGLPVTVEASPSTTEGLLDAMIHHLPVTDTLDLHFFAPRDMMTAVEGFLEQARGQGLTALRIIHGRGAGVQRDNVRRLLARTPGVAAFGDEPGNPGVTLVTLEA